MFTVLRGRLEEVFNPEFYLEKFITNRNNLRNNSYGIIKLKNITTKITKGATPKFVDKGILFVKSENVLENTLKINKNEISFISEYTYNEMKRSQLKQGDVLFNIVGASIGRACTYNLTDRANINQAIALIRLKTGYNPNWLSVVLNSKIYKLILDQYKSGGARDNIDLYQVNNFEIPKHDEEKQQEIVTKLNKTISGKQEKEKEAKELLDGLDKYLLRELGITITKKEDEIDNRIFTVNFSAVKGMRIDPLYYCNDNFLNDVTGSKYPTEKLFHHVKKFVNGFAAGKQDQSISSKDIIQIRPTNLDVYREFTFRKNIYISRYLKESKKSDLLQKNEVLFNNTNSQELVGKTIHFDLDGDYFCSNHMTRIKTKETINPEFLSQILNLYQKQKVFFNLCTNWNNQSGVNSSVLKTIIIPVPPIEKQKEIAEYISKKRKRAYELKKDAKNEYEKVKNEIENMIIKSE